MGRWVEYRDDGARSLVLPGAAREVFYGDCSDEVVAAATSRLVAHETATLLAPPGRALWREVPTTYVVCMQDNAIPAAYQESALSRASRFEVWPCSHSPFLSQPARVAGLLARLAAQRQRDPATRAH
jgi:pimeloyl-ACP methyl ester carboxylesterase